MQIEMTRRLTGGESLRRGFTLVEMLVSTALVMLMMVLFAQIYAAAVGTIREQEGISKNDQKARAISIVLENDLRNRTYREIPRQQTARRVSAVGLVPLARNVPVSPSQAGYFSYAENDHGNDSDDVLALTVFAGEGERFVGVCPSGGSTTAPNHPDCDDGIPGNSRTASRAAEIVYFLRGGNLYRRVNLLRDPLTIPVNGANVRLPCQPSTLASGNGPLIWTTKPPYWDTTSSLAWANANTTYFCVLGIESLSNAAGPANLPIGLPQNRFGFNGNTIPVLEYNNFGGSRGWEFIGRPTLAETATEDLNRNGSLDAMEDTNGNGKLDSRAGEDLLLTNVVAFDIKVWEPQDAEENDQPDFANNDGFGGRWVDIGHSRSGGIFGIANRQNSSYGMAPLEYTEDVNGNGALDPGEDLNSNMMLDQDDANGNSIIEPILDLNRVFDSWHPTRTDKAPYAPQKVQPTTAMDTAPGMSASVTADASDWTLSTIYFPRGSAGDHSFGYRALMTGVTGGIVPTSWPRSPGYTFVDGNVTWECFDNRIGLTAMRITIRYLDPGSETPRQVTLDHSFID